MNNSNSKAKPDPFNYDKEREKLKVNYSPHKDFTTMSMSAYKPYSIETKPKEK